MKNSRLDYLFQRQLNKQATTAEHNELMVMFALPENEAKVMDLFHNSWDSYSFEESVFTEGQSAKILKRVLTDPMTKPIHHKRLNGWFRYTVAAAILILLSAALYFFKASYFVPYSDIDRIANSKEDLAPGTNKAQLTLADGKTIGLNNGQTGIVINKSALTYTDGTSIIDTDDEASADKDKLSNAAEMVMLSTPKGGQYQLTLPDGTQVWLNASSSIKFPVTFSGAKERSIQLTGEAYFEVVKNKKMPFLVISKNQSIRVLGTHFNVNAYPDELLIRTTLFEGSVDVNSTIIKPGQQAIVGQTLATKVIEVNLSEAIAWKNGEFLFKNENLPSIMRKIARWYDVEVVFPDGQLDKETFSGSVSRYTNVSEILKTLELTGRLHFKIEGRKVIVSKK